MDTEANLYTLLVDEDFKKMFMPVTDKIKEPIKNNLLKHKEVPSIKVWKKIIVDGYALYTVCHEMNIPFLCEELSFLNKYEAAAYIAIQSINSKQINPERKKYCVGKLFNSLKSLGAANFRFNCAEPSDEERNTSHFNISRWRTAYLSGYSTVSLNTIYRHSHYATAIDNIYRLCPEFAYEILDGMFYLSHPNTLRVSSLSEESIKHLYATTDKHLYDRFMHEKINGYEEADNTKKKINRRNSSIAIKQMPKYDPDADFSSISFTISAWLNQLERLNTTARFNEASTSALWKLEQQLTQLKDTCEKILKRIEEEYDE